VFHKPHCASLPNVRCNCKMTTFKKILILTILFYNINNIVGQNKYHQFEDKNSTGRNVRLHQTMYDKDSTKSGYAHYFCSKCKSKGDDVTYIGLIRLDVIAIDDSTNDTLFIKTYNSDELNQDPFILNITNSKNKLAPEFSLSNRLLIKAKGIGHVYKINQIMAIKTNKRKIEGKLQSFNNSEFVLIDEEGNSITVNKNDLIGIKSCGALISSGPYFSMFKHCNYDRLEKVSFKTVKQVFNEKKNMWTWEDIK